MKNKEQTYLLVVTSMFIALIVMMALIPYLGLINLGFINVTTLHIPVIIGSILLGPNRGAILGFTFGLMSFIVNSWYSPGILSFVFSPVHPVPGTAQASYWSLVIVFVPRIILGIVPWYFYQLLNKVLKRKQESAFVAGVLATLLHTALVVYLIFFVFNGVEASDTLTIGLAFTSGLFITNGLPEALIGALITAAIVPRLLDVLSHRFSQNGISKTDEKV